MKTTLSTLTVAAVFSAAAFSLTTGTTSAQSSVTPPAGGYGDHVTAISPRGSEKHLRALHAEAAQLQNAAAEDLHAGKYILAESEARQSLALFEGSGVSEEVLATALEAQGKDQEALQQYHIIVIDGGDSFPRNLVPYAQLLLKSGQWAKALTIYNQALPLLPNVGTHPENPTAHDGDLVAANSHFSAEVPEPAALATALHIARGMIYNSTTSWSGDAQNTEAIEEYNKALRLAPDNALTNYFYGVGWQKLSPTERAKFGTVQQAKAHLRKAEKTGNASVKAAAAKTLKGLG